MDFGSLGATVLCISKTETAMKTAADIRAGGGKADHICVDLGDFEGAKSKVAEWMAGKPYRRIALVLAAASLGPAGPLKDACLTEWDAVWRANVLGNLAVTQAVLPSMTENRFGRLVFFAGGGAAYAYPLFPAYAATKTALVRAVENLNEDLKESGDFAVTILAPGAVKTDLLGAVQARGGYVRTTVSIEEPVNFVRSFILAGKCSFSGCFVHVRDEWPSLLNSDGELGKKDLWKLRRVE